MASFNVQNEAQYGGQGGGGFFSLRNDGDKATVRFLYDGIEDVNGMSVHEVSVNGKMRSVNCLREYGDPVDACPMCAANFPVRKKYFIPLYNFDTDRIEVWDRGGKWGQKLSSLCAHYPTLVAHRFEIERHGAAGSTQTTYDIYPLQDVPEDRDVTVGNFVVEPVLGGIVLDKTFDDMTTYVATGSFPGGQTDGGQQGGGYPRRGGDEFPRRTPNGGEGQRRQVF